MRRRRPALRDIAAIGILGVALLVPLDAHAISSCTASCNSNCTLTQDVTCDYEDGIILSGGADLDLGGHQITCADNCPQAAIKMTASGSIVKSTGGPGYIAGGFTYQINCQHYSGSEVSGIQVNAT